MSDVEDQADGTARNTSNIEGRINTFTWIIGLVFFLFCSMAFYGVVQIDKFKTIYTVNSIETNKVIAELSASVQVQSGKITNQSDKITDQSEKIDDIVQEVSELKKVNQTQHAANGT